MTSSTQAMNNVNKIQTASTTAKPGVKKDSIEVDFNELFSSAMGQKGPNSQLNSIESQLRESLFKQDIKTNKKNNESNSNAEAAQAAVWAQRNWMQAGNVPQMLASAPPAASAGNNAKAAEPIKQTNNQAQLDSKPLDGQTAKNETAPNAEKPVEAQTSTEQAAQQDTVADQQAGTTVPATSTTAAKVSDAENALPTNALSTDNELAPTVTTATNKPELAATTQTAVDPSTQTSDESVRSPSKSTGDSKVDNLMANATVNSKAETQVSTQQGTVGNTNANAVAAQLAPQIAQQAQNMGDELEPAGLKAGQKILAAGNLQPAGAANGLAAGTNGLNGTLGNAPQALIKTPVNQPGFAKEVGQTVQWAIGKNLSTVDIRVNPESFGPMNMRLIQKGQQVQLVIRTQDEASANLLTQALGGLKEVLAQNGLQLNQVQIQHGSGQNANGQNAQNQAQFEQQGHGQGRSGQQSSHGGANQQEAALPTVPTTARQAEGKLDLFA